MTELTHIDCVKKWPAVYKLMALVMDDVNLDPQRAKEVWGIDLVRTSEVAFDRAIYPSTVDDVVKCLADYLKVNLATPEKAPQRDVESSAPATIPARVASVPRPAGRGSGSKPTASKVTGTVIKVDAVEKEARFGGGLRHVMVVVPRGKSYGVEGTIPASHVGKLTVGDEITLNADVWEFDHRHGWFKYPKNLRVLEAAK